ncbi:hypothetical protein DPMN_129360 [Dreissena polymorpha]|uniref:Rho termination factor-like N-terminal domain-containing protein n=1 Tax=Dreissena polymorpha TaxID=45954 RepID=A0A9D4H2H6_DREPO|nr:hypothetical protein DPMN_129360 [Dreissena polymorpha]
MESKTTKELKKAAKDLGLRRYSRLRKHELIALLNKSGNAIGVARNTASVSLLNEPVPDIAVPVLKPARAKKPSVIERLFNVVKRHTSEPVKRAIQKSYVWILNHTPEPVQKVKSKKVDSLNQKRSTP